MNKHRNFDEKEFQNDLKIDAKIIKRRHWAAKRRPNVDFDDFFLFMDDFGRTSDSSLSCSAILSDFDCNHAVDINDFFLFADNYGKTVEVTADCGQVLNTDKNNTNASTFYGPASLAEALERVREISWNSLPTDPSDLSTVILGISTTF